ncbi:MAG: hypothetical protein OXF56_23370 [Rhodobacteraceae bacterium]|nr:hypothetical protein [Paracoccaceae bacterium]
MAASRILRALPTIVLWGVFSGGSWGVVVNDGLTVVTVSAVSISIGGEVYFGLATAALVGLIILHWPLVQKCTPNGRFRSLAPLINDAMAALESDDSYETRSDDNRILMGSAKAILRDLILDLEPFEITHPPFSESTHRWGVFLSRLLPVAKRGNIVRARCIWPDMQAE